MSAIESPPTQGTPEWYRWMEAKMQQLKTDIERLWVRVPPIANTVGQSPVSQDYEPPSSS